MSLEKPKKLMEVLLRRTARGEIEWQEGLTDVFQVSFKDNSVLIASHANEREETVTYAVSLLNSEGTVADRFTDEDLDKDEVGHAGGFWFVKLAELYAMARRRARGADKVLDDILKEVDDDDIPL
jgi:hypothetical protein